jgi:hypothetical protein
MHPGKAGTQFTLQVGRRHIVEASLMGLAICFSINTNENQPGP